MGSSAAGTAFAMYGKRGLFTANMVATKGSFRGSTLTRDASQRSVVTNASQTIPLVSGSFVFLFIGARFLHAV